MHAVSTIQNQATFSNAPRAAPEVYGRLRLIPSMAGTQAPKNGGALPCFFREPTNENAGHHQLPSLVEAKP
jgi:hypothetical protein